MIFSFDCQLPCTDMRVCVYCVRVRVSEFETMKFGTRHTLQTWHLDNGECTAGKLPCCVRRRCFASAIDRYSGADTHSTSAGWVCWRVVDAMRRTKFSILFISMFRHQFAIPLRFAFRILHTHYCAYSCVCVRGIKCDNKIRKYPNEFIQTWSCGTVTQFGPRIKIESLSHAIPFIEHSCGPKRFGAELSFYLTRDIISIKINKSNNNNNQQPHYVPDHHRQSQQSGKVVHFARKNVPIKRREEMLLMRSKLSPLGQCNAPHPFQHPFIYSFHIQLSNNKV